MESEAEKALKQACNLIKQQPSSATEKQVGDAIDQAAKPRVTGKCLGRNDPHQATHSLLHERNANEEEAKAGNRIAKRGCAVLSEQLQKDADQHQRKCSGAELQLEADQSDQPPCHRRADVGTQHDSKRLREREEPRPDEANGQDGGRTRRLHYCRRQRPGRGTRPGASRESAEEPPKRGACERAQALGEDDHAEKKKAEAAKARKNTRGHLGRVEVRRHVCLRMDASRAAPYAGSRMTTGIFRSVQDW